MADEKLVRADRPPARGKAAPGRRLSLELIVTETLALIDERGIAEASMRTVGERLGVRAMTLYRYIHNQEELFDAVVERIVNELNDDPQVPFPASDAGWRPYLEGLAGGVRRYAITHPHAFPLVATRPPSAPWVNPPLRSLRWIESVLTTLSDGGFTDDQVLFTYRSFNSFLLGHLLLETSARVLNDPQPGDGSFQRGDRSGGRDPVDPTDPVPASLSPTRTSAQREDRAETVDGSSRATDDLQVGNSYPTIHRLRAGLTEDRFDAEFAAGLTVVLDRIAAQL
ncbi:TetR/AcrR family transcriptional regulator [uncultured Jatrophihabitans sp.]|uniref:TetR/AcrR family transcriptional regulator n=1 Tax=uncultured Jatrophihabitans sp. TaxID=1610747 RepID=UPI0035C99668